MFSLSSRVQHIANETLSLVIVSSIFVVITFIAQLYATDVFSTTNKFENIVPFASIKHSYSYGAVNRKPKENTKVTFDLEADLTPLFTWNTKQVFAYITAEYEGKSKGSSNKVTYWDKIITSREDAVLNLTQQRSAYSVWDVENSFRNRDAVLRLEWNIQPYVGPLIYGSTIGEQHFTFPSKEN